MSREYLCWLLGHGFDWEAAGRDDFTCPRCGRNRVEPVIWFDRGVVPTIAGYLWHLPMREVSRAVASIRDCLSSGPKSKG